MKARFLLLGFFLSVGFAGEKVDNQFWHVEKISKPINDQLTFILHQDLRSENNAQDLYYVHSDAGFSFKAKSNLAVGLYFREVFTKKNSTWSSEHRPYGQVVGKAKISNLSVSGRARMEYRITSDKKKFRNRDMVTVKSGNSFSSWKLVPYLA
ncbi:MAG: DUF2490 domain-containing protein, partial [FCB group bacterium]|nr:DUF2490 domain-containing protein [FCB group bacterium]